MNIDLQHGGPASRSRVAVNFFIPRCCELRRCIFMIGSFSVTNLSYNFKIKYKYLKMRAECLRDINEAGISILTLKYAKLRAFGYLTYFVKLSWTHYRVITI